MPERTEVKLSSMGWASIILILGDFWLVPEHLTVAGLLFSLAIILTWLDRRF